MTCGSATLERRCGQRRRGGGRGAAGPRHGYQRPDAPRQFDRYCAMRTSGTLPQRSHGLRPITVIGKDTADRMASTVQLSRARGPHGVAGTADLLLKMLREAMPDANMCNELGMEPGELLRVKRITGFSKLSADRKHRRAWMARSQVGAQRRHQ